MGRDEKDINNLTANNYQGAVYVFKAYESWQVLFPVFLTGVIPNID